MAGKRNINIGLTFTANTAQAKAQMKQLQTQLTQLSAGINVGGGMTQLNAGMQESMALAAQLKVSLQNATNVNTGKLDLGKFNQQLKASNMTLSQYATSLQRLGPQGQQAFLSLARSIQNAENPLMRVSTGMKKLGTTLANTARWQISSSILMGFTRAISTAYNYAQDLNKSLNNIRIVTGQTAAQMDAFAKKANNAAKALSTTTVAYTDAALIYYQQGLKGSDVTDRADVTTKLANVTGKNAQEVSEWMTSIWNNFYDGSKSLESFADKIAALGATTASSAEEIATGLEKFAAVGETVGLSYDYAVSALATVTAETRQSADVVGTAFKTLFARMQDLKLGNALEDGTDLGQYADAMKRAGVNIKTATGELKDMDVILNELGTTWQTLDKGQQVALAKSVAGLRQYNQFIALMSNWDVMQSNLATTRSSEGELQDQQDIYAEGWEAAAKRVKAAAEEIYTSIFDDKFFIDILDFFAKFLNTIEKFMDAAGGLPVLLGTIGSILMTKFSGTIVDNIKNIGLGFMSLTKNGRAAAQKMKDEAWENVRTSTKDSAMGYGDQSRVDASIREAKMQDELNAKAGKMTQLERQTIQARMDGLKLMEEEHAKLGDEVTAQEKIIEKLREQVMLKSELSSADTEKRLSQFGTTMTQKRTLDSNAAALPKSENTVQASLGIRELAMQSGAMVGVSGNQIQSVLTGQKSAEDFVKSLNLGEDAARNLEQMLKSAKTALDELGKGTPLEKLSGQLENVSMNARKLGEVGFSGSIQQLAADLNIPVEQAEKYVMEMLRGVQVNEEFANSGERVKQTADEVNNHLGQAGQGAASFGNGLLTAVGGMGQMLMSINMMISGLSSMINMFKEGEFSLSGLVGGLTSLIFSITMMANGWKTLTGAMSKDTLAKGLNTVATWLNTKAQNANAASGKANMGDRKVETDITNQDTKHKLRDTLRQRKQNRADFKSGKLKYDQKAGRWRNAGKFTSQPKGLSKAQMAKAGAPVGKGASAAAGAGGSAGGAGAGGIGASLGAIAGPALLLAAGIAAAVGGVVLMTKLMNKHKEELKKTTAEAKRMKEQYARITEETDKFKSLTEEYHKSTKGLDQMVKGTLEYKQALLEANEQALELIKSSKRLQQPGAYNTVNGQIVIDEQALKEAQEEKLQYQTNQLTISQAAEAQKNQAKAEAEKTEFAKKQMRSSGQDFDSGSLAGYGGAAVAGALGGVGLAMGWNPVGWALLAVAGVTAIGTAIYGAVEGTATEMEQEALEHLQEQYEDMPEMFADKESLKQALGPEFEHLTDSLWENRDKLEDLIQSNESLRLQNLALERQMAAQIIESKYANQVDDRAKDAAATAVAGVTGSDEQNAYENDLLNEIKGQDGLLQDLYKKMHEQDGQTLTHMSGKKISILDANGELIGDENSVSQEGVAREMVNAVALAVRSGDDNQIEELKKLVDNTKGVNADNKKDIKDLIDKIAIRTEIDEAVKNVKQQASSLDQLDSFKGTENSAAFSQALNAIAEAKVNEEDANLGFLSREQIADLEKNIDKFDAATQKAIEAAKENYEYDKARLKLKVSTNYDQATADAEAESKLVSRAGIDAGVLDTYEDQLADVYGLEQDRAEAVAKFNLNAKAGVEGLIKVFSDYDSVLDKSKKGTLEYSQGITAIKKAYQDWFGVEIDTKTVEENMEKFKKAAEGDIDAIQKLQDIAADQLLISFDLDDVKLKEAQDLINQLRNSNIKVGMDMDTEGAAKKLGELYNSMIHAGLLSTAEAKASLEALGFSVETKTVASNKSWWNNFKENMKKGQSSGTALFNTFANSDVSVIDLEKTVYQGKAKDNDTGMAAQAAAEEKKKNSEARESLKNEKKRSYETKRWIDALAKSYEALNKAKDQAFGADKLKLLEQEEKLLSREIAAQKQLLEETKSYLSEDKSNLEKYGVSFKGNGQVANYSEIEQNYINRLNAIGDTDSDAYKDLKEEYQEFKDDIEKYDSTFDEVKEIELTITDKEAEELQLQLDKIELKVDVKLNLSEAEKDAADFQLEMLQDIPYEAVRTIQAYQSKYGAGQTKYDAGKLGLENIMKNKGFTDEEIAQVWAGKSEKFDTTDWTQDEIEDIKNYKEDMTSGWQEARDTWKEMHDYMKSTFSDLNEEFDNAIDRMESWNTMVDHYGDLIGLLGKENLGITDEQEIEILDTKIDIINGQIEAAKKKLDSNTEFLAKAEAGLAAAEADLAKDNNDAAKARVEYWKDMVLEAQNEVAESQSQLNELLMAGLEAASQKKTKEVEQATDDFLKALTGFDSFEDWDRDRAWKDKQGSFYLDEYEKNYELSKLTRSVNESLDKTSLKNQQGLKKVQDAINKAKEKGLKMSKAEVDLLQKQLDIENAKIALEEAQNNKSKVQMVQDTEGNFGYVYTADENKVNEAAQNLDDAIYNSYQSQEDYTKSMGDMYYEATKEFIDSVKEIESDLTLTVEEREQRLQEAQERYLANTGYVVEQTGIILGFSHDIYNDEYIARNESLNQMAIAADNHLKSYKDNYLVGLSGYIDEEKGYYDSLAGRVDAAIQNMETYGNEYLDTWTPTFLEGLKTSLIGEDPNSVIGIFQALETLIGSPDVPNSLYGRLAAADEKMRSSMVESFKQAGIDVRGTLLGEGGTSLAATINEFINGPNGNDGAVAKVAQLNSELSTVQSNMTTLGGMTETLTSWEKTNVQKFNNMAAAIKGVNDEYTKLWGNQDKEANGGNTPSTLDLDSLTWNKLDKGDWQVSTQSETVLGGYSTYNKQGTSISGQTMSNVFNPNQQFSNNEVYTATDDTGKVWYKVGKTWLDKDGFENNFATIPQGAGNDGTTTLTPSQVQSTGKIEATGTYDGGLMAIKVNGEWWNGRSVGYTSLSVGSKANIRAGAVPLDESRLDTAGPVYTIDTAAFDHNDNEYYHIKGTDIWIDAYDFYQAFGSKKRVKWKKNGSSLSVVPTDFQLDPIKHGGKTVEEVFAIKTGYSGLEFYPPLVERYNSSNGVLKTHNILPSVGSAFFSDINGVNSFSGTSIKMGAAIKSTAYKHKKDSSGENWYYLGNGYYYPESVLKASPVWALKGQAFDTGGYTGSWGPDGRWAMLHQKEIVLNAHDTENFLTAIDIVRSMVDQLEFGAKLTQQGILSWLTSATPTSVGRDQLEQTVTIHAEFPNATNHSEIEEAFGNLVNLAAQHINRTY